MRWCILAIKARADSLHVEAARLGRSATLAADGTHSQTPRAHATVGSAIHSVSGEKSPKTGTSSTGLVELSVPVR